MHIMIQPVASDRLLSDTMLEGLGLLARMVVSAPPSTAGRRMYRAATTVAKQNLDDYSKRMTVLLRLPPLMDGDALKPEPIGLYFDARAMWIGFHDEVEAQLVEGGAYRSIRGFGAKLAEHAGRLAAVLAFYELGGKGAPIPIVIQASHMAGGIELAQHYAGEMLRLIGGAAVASELRIAPSVLDWLKTQRQLRFHLADIYQRGPSSVRSAATARTAMAELVDHGHVRRLKEGEEIDGAKRREAWEVVV